jgi:hypothetical protein
MSRILPGINEDWSEIAVVNQLPSGGSSAQGYRETPLWLRRLLIGAFGIAAGAMVLSIAVALIVPPIIQGTVERYTSTQPMPINTATLDEAERETLDDRLGAFEDALDEGQTPEPLMLSGTDLNSLLQDLWDDEELPGEMALRIEDGRIRSEISIPIEPGITIGPFTPQVQGRYLNGTVTFRVEIQNNTLEIDIERFIVNGQALPGWIVDAIERQVIQEGLLQNPDLDEFTAKIERLQVSADTIVIEAAE